MAKTGEDGYRGKEIKEMDNYKLFLALKATYEILDEDSRKDVASKTYVQEDRWQTTLLSLACQFGDSDLVRDTIAHGADVNARVGYAKDGNYIFSPLTMAIEGNEPKKSRHFFHNVPEEKSLEIVKILCENGANPNLARKGPNEISAIDAIRRFSPDSSISSYFKSNPHLLNEYSLARLNGEIDKARKMDHSARYDVPEVFRTDAATAGAASSVSASAGRSERADAFRDIREAASSAAAGAASSARPPKGRGSGRAL